MLTENNQSPKYVSEHSWPDFFIQNSQAISWQKIFYLLIAEDTNLVIGSILILEATKLCRILQSHFSTQSS